MQSPRRRGLIETGTVKPGATSDAITSTRTPALPVHFQRPVKLFPRSRTGRVHKVQVRLSYHVIHIYPPSEMHSKFY